MKNFQLFITRHYDAIKLFLMTIILAFVIFLVFALGSVVKGAVEEINAKADEQTAKIDRQFQALCFLIIETSGQEALRQLDPPLEEQCKDLSRDLRKSSPAQSEKQTQRSTQAEPVEPRPVRTSTQPESQTPQPYTPAQPPVQEEPGLVPSAINGIRDTLNSLLRR